MAVLTGRSASIQQASRARSTSPASDAEAGSSGMDEPSPPFDPEISSLIEQTLAMGFVFMRFPAKLEAIYNKDTAAQRLRVLLTAGTIVAFVINLFLVADAAMIPDMFEQSVMLRTWIYTPGMLVGMWLLSLFKSSVSREVFATSAGFSAALIHLYLCLNSNSPHALAYLAGLSMMIIYVNVFTRCHFWIAMPYTMSLVGMFWVAVLLMPHPNWALAFPIALVLISTNVFSLYHLYVLEHEERHNYLMSKRQRLLSHELRLANERLERVSRSDALTQVANRRHFDEFLAQLWERAKRDNTEVSLLMLDVDHFKRFNDHYGHPAGDACLVRVARSLRHSLRRPGDLVARYGGEEFIAVLGKTANDRASAVAERVRSAVEALALPHAMSPTYDKVTVSVGVATLHPLDKDASPERLIALADQALYQAKNRGRNRVWPPGGWDPDPPLLPAGAAS